MRFARWIQAALALWFLVAFVFLYGWAATKRGWFPAPQVDSAQHAVRTVLAQLSDDIGPPYRETTETRRVAVHDAQAMAPGLTLITGLGPEGSLQAQLIRPDGTAVHTWDLTSFRLWPDPQHIPAEERPKQRPGTVVHGIVLSPNGDLTFNYENIGMVQVDFCGRPKWRLAERTHHSIVRDGDGNFWATAFRSVDRPPPYLWGVQGPIMDDLIIAVSPSGEVIRRISVFDLIARNDAVGLFRAGYSSRTNGRADLLHQNSIEFFPAGMTPGVYGPGDMLLSLRNASSIVVFNVETMKIKDIIFGPFIYQHDPHFEDGSTISIFDNNYEGPFNPTTAHTFNSPPNSKSRIVAYSATDRRGRVLFEGTPDQPFYTAVMGKQQPLANGNRLLTEANAGRALEIDAGGRIVWEYFNLVEPGVLGLLASAERLPPAVFPETGVAALKAQCAAR